MEEQATPPMKLSQAIRAGAAIRPQGFGGYAREIETGCFGTCALGAAYEAVTGSLPDPGNSAFIDVLYDHWPQLYRPLTLPDAMVSTMLNEIIVLNDVNMKSREEIADWLEAQGW